MKQLTPWHVAAPGDEGLMRHQSFALVCGQAAFVAAVAATGYSGL